MRERCHAASALRCAKTGWNGESGGTGRRPIRAAGDGHAPTAHRMRITARSTRMAKQTHGVGGQDLRTTGAHSRPSPRARARSMGTCPHRMRRWLGAAALDRDRRLQAAHRSGRRLPRRVEPHTPAADSACGRRIRALRRPSGSPRRTFPRRRPSPGRG